MKTKANKQEYYDERLHDMLRYKRPHQSKAEADWIERFIKPYQPYALDDAALCVPVANPDGTASRVMFSCHTDTVHRDDGRQHICYNRSKHHYYKKDGSPLGADDAAGAWVMLEMIDAGVPGMYVFHRGEECGGIGSRHIASTSPAFLKRFDYAVAFDRRGSTSVITHQGWSRCCSDVFAQALADAINDDGVSMYAPDDSGVFTDTANYTEFIPECTNLSCGYANEHTGNETLHLPTLFALRDACLRIDWHELPVVRDPAVEETLVSNWSYNYQGQAYAETGHLLYDMTRAEMEDMAYTDPETFVALVRQELFNEPVNTKPTNIYSHWEDDYYYDRSFK